MRRIALSAALLCGIVACADDGRSSLAPAAASLDSARSDQISPAPTSLSLAGASAPIPGQYIVRYRQSAVNWRFRVGGLHSTIGAKVSHVYMSSLINGAVLQMSDSAASVLRNDPSVLSVEQDQTLSIAATQANPPSWGLDRLDQRARQLNQSYDYANAGAGVTVYILDSGINLAQADFQGRASAGPDYIIPSTSGADCNGHGTHVAGTVGGAAYGVAKQARIVAVRVLNCSGSGTTSGVVAGIDWVIANAVRPAVANMSLGGKLSATLNAAVEAAVTSGITFVVAAGNSGIAACSASPASAPNAITVGATDGNDAMTSWSNHGSCVDINAPGASITSLWLGSGTNTISGTSMAAPHVAGAAALYLNANPTSTPAQVNAALTSNATTGAISGLPVGTPDRLLYTGFLGAPPPPPPPVAPVANFTSSCTFLVCTFNASSTTAQANATYGWNFGDGSTGAGVFPNRTYATSGTYTVTLTVTDPNGTSTKSATVTVAANQPPVAAITAPTSNAAFTRNAGGTVDVAFAGTANDPEAGALTGSALVWTSNRDGQIGTGTSFTWSYLSIGTHIITLTARDVQGAVGTATRTITIAPAANVAPSATITSPANNASFTRSISGTVAVSFAGTGNDPETGALTGASLAWTSDRDGQIGTGTSFTRSDLSVGVHSITLTARDAEGATGTATQVITIIAAVNQAPTALITAPTNNAVFTRSISGTVDVSFAGTGTDPESGALADASLVWTSDRDGQIGTGTSFTRSDLSVGTHTITLTARDAQGASGSAIRTITIAPALNQAPTASISAPVANATSAQGTSIAFAGTGTDPESGALTGASLVWTSSIGGQIGTGTSFSTSTLVVGTHVITLTATDAQGARGTATRSITITSKVVTNGNQPPVASFTVTCGLPTLTSPFMCAYNALGSTDDSYSWIKTYAWSFGDGATQNRVEGKSFKYLYPQGAGTYTITLTVIDNYGLSSTTSKTVTLQ